MSERLEVRYYITLMFTDMMIFYSCFILAYDVSYWSVLILYKFGGLGRVTFLCGSDRVTKSDPCPTLVLPKKNNKYRSAYKFYLSTTLARPSSVGDC